MASAKGENGEASKPASDSNRQDHIKDLKEKFLRLRSEALKRGLSEEQVRAAVTDSGSPEPEPRGVKERCQRWVKRFAVWAEDPAHRYHVVVLLLSTAVVFFGVSFVLLEELVVSTPCLMDANIFSEEIFRPKVDCDICRDLQSVPEEHNISAERFYELYSFTGRPVLVKGALHNWTAVTRFSFKFFQELYANHSGSLEVIDEECQFFPYQTDFFSLEEALSMSDARAAFKPGEKNWYIGWSNCHQEVGKELRKHYQRPYFLPPDSESVAEDWIFMGGPGKGAGLHLDYVERPSWQAQISGTKTWDLVPSPECQSVCKSFNVTVHKGDIIVIDTNMWYHSTFVHDGEISITIGSEFD